MSKRILLVAGVACLAIAAAWYLVLWSPGQSALSAAKARGAAADQRSGDLRTKVAALEAAKKNLPAIQGQLDALRKAAPDTPQLDQAIATVNSAAVSSGVSLQSLAPSPIAAPLAGAAVTAGGLDELHLTMSVSGTYFQTMDFVHRISATPRLIVVDTMSMTGGDKGAPLTTALSSRMFVQPKASSTTGASGPAVVGQAEHTAQNNAAVAAAGGK